MKAWMRTARHFELNDDFDTYGSMAKAGRTPGTYCLADLMAVMKNESSGKRTIQALADKLMLHQLLENLDVPQLPALLAIWGAPRMEDVERDIANFVDSYLSSSDSREVVLKPTHLSNGAGVLVLSKVEPEQRDQTISYLAQHVQNFMSQQAGAHESLALQSLTPGFIAQPKYQSVVGFKTPLELRVVALWGKVRLGLWWWGRQAGAPGEQPQRNVWIVRRSVRPGHLSSDDCWEVLHEHEGSNPGFDSALELFERHMPAMAATTEAMAAAFGSPFLRADFFVGSAEWGVRLNEVAYGCGVDYRSRSEEDGCRLMDDAPQIARILEEGMGKCRQVYPARHFLQRLGVQGDTYEDMAVAKLPKSVFSRLPPHALQGGGDDSAERHAVPEDMCKTIKAHTPPAHGAGTPRSCGYVPPALRRPAAGHAMSRVVAWPQAPPSMLTPRKLAPALAHFASNSPERASPPRAPVCQAWV